MTYPDHPQVCRSLLFRSSSRSRRSQIQASYQASRTGSSFWTGWVPCSPRTGLKHNKQAQWEFFLYSTRRCIYSQPPCIQMNVFHWVVLTNREARSQEKQSVEGIHPVSQKASHRVALTLASGLLYISSTGPWESALSAVHTTQEHTPHNALTLSVNISELWPLLLNVFDVLSRLELLSLWGGPKYNNRVTSDSSKSYLFSPVCFSGLFGFAPNWSSLLSYFVYICTLSYFVL